MERIYAYPVNVAFSRRSGCPECRCSSRALPRPPMLVDVAGPATCHLTDENGSMYRTLAKFRAKGPVDSMLPSPAVADQYTLEV